MTHLRNPMFHDEEKAREWFEARVLAEWPVLPALRRNPNSDPLAWQGRREGNQGAPRPHRMQWLPRAIHRNRQHRLRAQQAAPHEMVARDLPAQFEQEGHVSSTDASHDGRQLQSRVVPVPSRSRSHARRQDTRRVGREQGG